MLRATAGQMTLAGFKTPFGEGLDANNRWVKLAEQIPWTGLCAAYEKRMSGGQGRPAKPARVVIGAVIVKHKLKLSDEETVEQLRENAYLQYFLGYTEFRYEQPFAASLFVEIRRRMGEEVFAEFEQTIIAAITEKTRTVENKSDDEPPTHQGELIVDATVVEQGIKYPTDQQLLNEAREISETIIDELHPQTTITKKPRTYRRKARRAFLRYSKKRKQTQKDHRRAQKQQLQYLKRNLGHIVDLLNALPGRKIPLNRDQLRKYWIIQELFAQQREMYQSGERSHADRIVSISQPQVRPMVRGKTKKPVEFGSKLSVSLNDKGIATVDRLSWDAYHEAGDLPEQVEAYKARHGHWPTVVLADGLYGTRENREWLDARGIRFGGKPLGRPAKDTARRKERAQQLRRDELARIPIEGKFGQVKSGYNLDRVAARTKSTAEAWIRASFLVVNLLVLSRTFLCRFFDGAGRFEHRLVALLSLATTENGTASDDCAIFQLQYNPVAATF